MDYTEIVRLALDGQDYSEKTKEFTDDQRKELDFAITKGAKEAKEKTLVELSGLTAEKRRREQALKDNPPKEDPTVVQKFQKEQEDQAKQDFLSDPDFQVPDALKATFEDTYASLKKGEVSKEQISKVLRRAYAATMGDELIESKRKVAQGERDAAAYKASGARASVSISEPDRSKYSKEAQDLFGRWQAEGYAGKNYTLERAQQITRDGLYRQI